MNSQLLARIIQIDKSGIKLCLDPNLRCEGRAIRAHSIQNSKVLDLLAENGHLVGLKRRMDNKKRQVISFTKIGRNEATTFTGFCEYHDQTLFEEIDKKTFDPTNKKQLFLFAYRAACYELHRVMEGAAKLQAGYKARVELGLSRSNHPSISDIMGLDFISKSYETWLYRSEKFDKALLSKSFDSITHDVIVFNGQRPAIAACALFSLDHLIQGDDVVRVAINILPTSQSETVVIFSYENASAGAARSALAKIFEASGDDQKFELSKILLNYCQNFVIAPAHFKQWTKKKVKTIEEYFLATLYEDNLYTENTDLFLF